MDSRYVQQFKKGSLEMILLCLIAKKETYGYEIITELNNNGAAVLGYAKEGTVYPILYRLQEADLIQCRIAPAAANGGSKKILFPYHKGKRNSKRTNFLLGKVYRLRELLYWRLPAGGGVKMREKYIKQVEKELHIPHKAKKEVVRDLNEIFASALENGETEQQVIERLGSPKEFAESTAEQLGIDITALRNKRGYFRNSSTCYRCYRICDLWYNTCWRYRAWDNRTGRRYDKYTNRG